MRRTALMRTSVDARVIVTTAAGTEVLDAEEERIEVHAEDRHEEILARYLAEGWRIAEEVAG